MKESLRVSAKLCVSLFFLVTALPRGETPCSLCHCFEKGRYCATACLKLF
jgi:hypothetical protein